ncbi:tripartite tricarboxylate transporter substrate binding protein [Polynucleobacter sp. IMCC 29146]|uniref:Bug family tripartite tricarboxylate transporter substrate binding protein n=1 Tax=Polynucleobacter sp. IMCC 29146 TaxID=2780953 RepID=UPI001F22624A|nr:tripartite tricarboxylate transporter substrate binding protein [Polynucleobacter sp. IMCC 29146]MCE7530423.1 tripartite tricarboxylate transporter substrate binding protein [Polynucleobacter sp. IMCC 29146]
MNSFSKLLVLTVALFSLPALAQQTYPQKPITLVVPYPPGGSADILARALAPKLGERLGQTILIENRAGAGTAIGAKAVASAAPDGYTLLLGTVSSNAINPAMTKVGYDPIKDFVAIAPVAAISFVLVANPTFPRNNVGELIAYAKANPEKVSYASAGPGTSNHLAGVMLASAAQINLVHVPYKGSAPALNDVIGGHVPIMFDLIATAQPMIQAGKVKALAVTSKARTSLLPQVPTMRESGLADYQVSAWFGIFGPAEMPIAIINKLNLEITAVIKNPEMQKRLRELGAEPETATPQEYERFVREEAAKWVTVVKLANLAP